METANRLQHLPSASGICMEPLTKILFGPRGQNLGILPTMAQQIAAPIKPPLGGRFRICPSTITTYSRGCVIDGGH